MALARVLPLTDIVLILPRGSYHLFLLGEVDDILYGWSSAKPFTASSSMMASGGQPPSSL